MPDGDNSLEARRGEIFSLLLMRLQYLHSTRELPSSTYIGKEYVEDKKSVRCTILLTFLFPGQVDPFEFWFNNSKVTGFQTGAALLVAIDRKISRQLWDDLRLIDMGQQFIIQYVTALMPSINRRLIENRYNKGHLLSRTFAVFEAVEISITVSNRRIWIAWPPSLPPFPPTVQLSGGETPLYVRDYIDSINSYFRHEYEDCVRRVITGTENFLDANQWKGAPRKPSGIFEWLLRLFGVNRKSHSSVPKRLRDNVDLQRLFNQVITANLKEVYAVRNKIVHSGFRMSIRSTVFCDKAICSLYYLIQRHCGDSRLSQYAYTLHQQFTLQKQFFGQMYNLDDIAKWKFSESLEGAIVQNDRDLETFIFEGLRITDGDIHAI